MRQVNALLTVLWEGFRVSRKDALMAKVGNYVQRDYHGTYSSKKKSTWSDFNKSWGSRRAAAAEKMQNVRSIAANFTNIATAASQTNTSLVIQSIGSQSIYASPTAVMSRINVVV